jgi:hypothetical protein
MTMASPASLPKPVLKFVSLVDAVVIAAMGILGNKLPKSDRWYFHRYASQFRGSRKMSADQRAAKLEELQIWWAKLERGDPEVMPLLKDLLGTDRRRFVELFRGDTAKRVRDGIIASISGTHGGGQAMAMNEVARETEESLRRDYPSALERLIIEDVVNLLLSAHEADLRAQALDSRHSLKQAAYYNDQRRVARRMLNSAMKLLVTVNGKLAETKRLAHPDRNDWQYSNRLGQYAHSRN